MWTAARRCHQRIEGLWLSDDPRVALTASMVGENIALKFDLCIDEQISRTKALAPEDYKWLTIHCRLEVDHVADSRITAQVLDDMQAPMGVIQMAAESFWNDLNRVWDDLYEVCFNLPEGPIMAFSMKRNP
jgi:hypothetical protein